MNLRFRLVSLPYDPFARLFDGSDEHLATINARRVIADSDRGFPCRVGLRDARVGDELLLLPWVHQAVDSPYHASGPIYVARNSAQRVLDVGEVPPAVLSRLISLRAYDRGHMMVHAEVCEGTDVARAIGAVFANEHVDYLHLHHARQGCYSCRVVRA